MSSVEKIIYSLQATMAEPKTFGLFHILWIGIIIISLVFLYLKKDKLNDKSLRIILAVYGFGSLFLEILKQIVWSFNYDQSLMIATWDYPWYIFPFQLCSTPMYVAIICVFLKKSPIRTALLSYISYITIWGSIMTIIMPDSCFVETILVNIHTMYLHCGSFILSIFLLMIKEVKISINHLLKAYCTFLVLVLLALILNVVFYNFIVPVDESFNMFYISPYLISDLPVLSTVQANCPYFVYIIFYLFAFFVGSSAILGIGSLIQRKRRVI